MPLKHHPVFGLAFPVTNSVENIEGFRASSSELKCYQTDEIS